jgi:hypothetical protein
MSTTSKHSPGNGKKVSNPAEPFRASVLEKARLIASAATRAGFKGLADFIRTTVLNRALFSR